MDILDLVTTALEPLNIIVSYGWYDENLNATHITFLEFDNVDSDFADDEATSNEHWLQTDIWTKDTLEGQTLKKQVKELLKLNGLLYQDGQDQHEPQTDGLILWHIASRWLIVEDLG